MGRAKKMKENFLSILIVITLAISANAQSFDKNNIAVCYFNVNIDPNLGITPDKGIADNIYGAINTVLHDSAGIQLNNIDFLKDKVTYFLGYPIGNAKNAAKSKLCHNYVKIVVDILPEGIYSTNNGSFKIAEIGKEKKQVKSKIKVAISMIVYDENGQKIKELSAKSTSKEKLVLNSESFLIGNFSILQQKKNDSSFETFQEIACQSIEELARKSK